MLTSGCDLLTNFVRRVDRGSPTLLVVVSAEALEAHVLLSASVVSSATSPLNYSDLHYDIQSRCRLHCANFNWVNLLRFSWCRMFSRTICRGPVPDLGSGVSPQTHMARTSMHSIGYVPTAQIDLQHHDQKSLSFHCADTILKG
jgi:hypothetical protein